MIHYITPGHSDLNLGREINNAVRLVNDDDWICLRDIDTMPAYHEVFFKQVEDISKTNYGLVGCITNRLGLKHHLIDGEKSENSDWKYHRQIGKERYEMFGSSIVKCDFNMQEMSHSIGGVMMLFPKKVWESVGGFKEGGIAIDGKFFDWHFTKAVIEKGFKIGIASGIYLIHMYRPDAKDTRYETSHLRK